MSQLLKEPGWGGDVPLEAGLWPMGARLGEVSGHARSFHGLAGKVTPLRGRRNSTARVVRSGTARVVRLGVREPLRSHAPVLALTLLRRVGDRDEVLVGVRTKYNGTHQNVMSVPTIRVLPEVARKWRRPLRDGVLSTDGLQRHDAVRRAAAWLVGDLMARKLGKADELERGEVTFEVEAMMAIQGTSLLGSHDGRDVVEDLTMFNAQVRWTAGNDLGEGRTPSYDPLLWVTEDQFAEMVRHRDVGVLDADLDAIEVCVRGLCIDSTMRMLDP